MSDGVRNIPTVGAKGGSEEESSRGYARLSDMGRRGVSPSGGTQKAPSPSLLRFLLDRFRSAVSFDRCRFFDPSIHFSQYYQRHDRGSRVFYLTQSLIH